MPVLVDRIGRIDVNCLLWIGRVSGAEALAMPAQIDASRPQSGGRWISYFDVTADLSDLDATCLLRLRERLRSVVSALAVHGEFRMILASNSIYNDPLLAVWRTMAVTDADYASNAVIVRDLEAAARALGLSAADAAYAQDWIDARIEPFSRPSRPFRSRTRTDRR